jgi:hypothetical protein
MLCGQFVWRLLSDPMRKYLAAIFLLLVSASLAVCIQKPTEWIKYTSPEGRYSVSLPALPRLSAQEATNALGEKSPQYLAVVVEPGDVTFVIGYFDSVPGTIFSADAARDRMVRLINGTLITETTISLGDYPGRELKIVTTLPASNSAVGEKTAKGVEYMLRARLYEADKRVYVLQLISPKSLESDALSAKATKYFDSFQVVQN